MVTRAPLPNQSSAVAFLLRQWIKFLMGIAAKNNNLPEPPSDEELTKWQQWAQMRTKRVLEHLDGVRVKYGQASKADGQLRYNAELSRLRTIIAPPRIHSGTKCPFCGFFWIQRQGNMRAGCATSRFLTNHLSMAYDIQIIWLEFCPKRDNP